MNCFIVFIYLFIYLIFVVVVVCSCFCFCFIVFAGFLGRVGGVVVLVNLQQNCSKLYSVKLRMILNCTL